MAERPDPRDRELAEDLQHLTAEERLSMQPISKLEILDYLEGQLDEAAAADVRERLSLDPEAAALALDLADPDRLSAPDESELPSWEHIRKTLVEAPGTASARQRTGVHAAWQWAAVFLLIATVGLAGLTLSRQKEGLPIAEPSAMVQHYVLRADEERQDRDGPGEVRIETQSLEWLMLILTAGDLGDVSQTEVTLTDANGRHLQTLSAPRDPSGTFDVVLPADFAPAGRYVLRLTGMVDGQRQDLKQYSFEVR